MISVNNNMGNLRAQDALQTSHRVLQTSLERLSTGVRINRAEDDAAGITVRDRFAAQINGYDEGIRNIQTGMGMIQVAEQGLNKITDALQQMRSLAVRAADDNLTDKDRQGIQAQVKGLLLEVNQRAQNTTYNGHNLLNGSIADAHAERQGSAQVQTNSFLASGNKMVSGAESLGTNATTVNAISQGSYEVKLVFDATKRDNPVATTETTITGKASSGNAYLNSSAGVGAAFTTSQTIYDREGTAHDMNVTFSGPVVAAGVTTWNYVMSGGSGGAWSNPVNFSGTVAFDAHGNFTAVTAGGGTTTTAVAGSKVKATIGDGSAGGQNWSVDFGKLRENNQSVAVNVPNAVDDGIAGSPSTRSTVTGNLNADAAAGTLAPAAPTTSFTDRLGLAHTVTYTLQKSVDQTGASQNADTWNVTLSGLTGGGWNGSSSNTSNIAIQFDSAGNVASVNGKAGTTMTANIGDGTAGGQDILVDFSSLTNIHGAAVAGPSATADGSTGAGTPTLSVGHALNGVLNPGAATVGPISDGVLLDPTVTLTKVSQTQWTMTDSAGAGTSTLTFDNAGHLTSAASVTVNGTTYAVGGLSVAPVPTTNSALAPGTRLSAGAGPTTVALNNLVSRTGTKSVPGASITFSQVGDSNSWNYQVNAPTSSGYTGAVAGGSGTVSFDEQGTLQGPSTFSATLADGTAEGQTVAFDVSQIHMGRAADMSASASDGSQGTGELQVDAAIFFSRADGTSSAGPIATLADVSGSARTANLGGISFTVAKVSTMDVGLTSYVKAYTYVSAQTQDNALQFQVGPDEGMIHRVGIAKMDAQTLLRGNDATYKYQDVKLETTLQAQDLIGQVDDALNFVSAENLKVGQFQNQFTRTLDLARQQNTSITNAQSNLNDADMATEATNQSKRMILVQSGTAMVAQANTTSQFLLQLLR